MKTLDLEEAAEFLKMNTEVLRRKVRKAVDIRPGVPCRVVEGRLRYRAAGSAAKMRCAVSIYKRRGSRNYWLKITIPGQPPVQRSAGTANRREAQEYHDQLKAQLWRQAKLGEKRSYLWEEAVLRFLQETSHKRDHHGDRSRLRWLHPYLEGYPLESISRELLDHIMQQKSGKAPGTINRYLATVRSILRKAHREWDWLDSVPAIRMREEPKQRIRWITREEAAQLLTALPSHLSDGAENLSTIQLQSNVVSFVGQKRK